MQRARSGKGRQRLFGGGQADIGGAESPFGRAGLVSGNKAIIMPEWWHLQPQEISQSLRTDLSAGLSAEEGRIRLAEAGPNRLREAKGPSALSIFLSQFQDFIIWVLIAAALVSGFLREWADALAIIAIVALNAVLGFIQEFRAEKSLAALKKLSSPSAKVIRGAERQLIPAGELVPGDLIELEAGDHIPADSRIIWLTENFATQEASLTGESTPVAKTALALEAEAALADRQNMLYLGTAVVSGKARAVVVETGMRTELGKIAGMIQGIKHEATPLQKKLEAFGKWIVWLCLFLVGLVFLLGWLRGGDIMEVFLTAVSLAVAAIPEGLPAVATIALSLGVHRMAKRHALIRKLPSVETLGCATVICSDKTGTLTKNEMTVQAVYADNALFELSGIGYAPQGGFSLRQAAVNPRAFPALEAVLNCGVLCNGAQLIKENGGYRIFGDPTEAALLTAAAKAGIFKPERETEQPFLQEIPFDSRRKKMTILRRQEGKVIAYVKGAPDVLLNDCAFIQEGAGARAISVQDKEAISRVNNQLAQQAMRVLAVGYRVFPAVPEDLSAPEIEREIIFAGLFAMIDPARPEVRQAIEECASAGIRPVMITGDHKNTAAAIARQLGFFREDSLALSGEELDKLSDEEFQRQIAEIPVYARVSPEHKLRIVRAWRSRGEVVAMTGDGVNDAPAVKEADIGVAMGITGTDVAKEVSDMVITDDNFASIVAAVEEGRGIYDNIRKFVHYLLSCNAGEILVMFISSLCGLPAPLLPIQILWVNLVTDGLPALALGVDPVDPGIMRRPPRPAQEAVVTRKGAMLMLGQGSLIAFCSLLAFALVLFVEKGGIESARSAAFIVLSCSQLAHAFNCRSHEQSLFRLGLLTNKKLILAVLISFLLQMAVVYLPFLQGVFKTRALGLPDWLMVLAISSLPFWLMEAVKALTKPRR
jgi:Ca2+-transporting ATPase